MPNLKDIRIRINSVKTTRQVTSAMKMVSAAKFKKAQDDISHIRPYVDRLAGIIFDLSQSLDEGVEFEWSSQRDPEKVLLVVVSSNRGLCGAFNSNVIKETEKVIRTKFAQQFKQGTLDIFAIGKQAQKLLKSHGYPVTKDFNDLYSHLTFEAVKDIAKEVMDAFQNGTYDNIVLIYNEFKNAAVQIVRSYQFLPLQLPEINEDYTSEVDYIIEPDNVSFIKKVIPNALQTMFYRVILESMASEHGARMTSMHKATDNATEMLSDLQLAYNKARQGAITTEILEIVGGAEALKK
ncbi:ATP synthase F1 subunit gamma [Carboxylicivirga linearis]|uniref:ATP synthase gamma chain n=1 Tax=Carboxylicivirga linearis TaxID=1628157 RepID=A0ABS5JR16_9BACT|nr:ATP synthase F1 subunit gamma [Carboxylicivirga linearis]MBS2096931.1 ATP synthase F1 subunit gamma [Carboxylicivirga linearis]